MCINCMLHIFVYMFIFICIQEFYVHIVYCLFYTEFILCAGLWNFLCDTGL